MNIVVYTKLGCPWSKEVFAYLNEKNLVYTQKEVSLNGENLDELIKLTGQTKSPTLIIDGHVIANTDVKEVSEYIENIKPKT